MAARTLYKLQLLKHALAFSAGEFAYFDAETARKLIGAGTAQAIDAVPGATPTVLGSLRHALRRETLAPPVDEADRVVLQHLAGILGCGVT